MASLQIALDLQFLATDAVSLVPMEFDAVYGPGSHSTVAMPLHFRHRPAPYVLARRGRSRMALPSAIVSIDEIAPRTSKSSTGPILRL